MSGTFWLKRFMGLVAALAIALMTAPVVVAPTAQARVLSAGIKGVVLDAQTAKGVGGVRVFVMEKWYPWGQGTGDQDWAWTAAAETVTGKGGSYSIKLSEAGTYRVFFVPGDLTRYAMEAYPNAPVAEEGDDVVVRYGRVTSGISVRLDPSNRIEGHIYQAESRWNSVGDDDGTYDPLEGVTVRVCFQSLVIISCFIRLPEQGSEVPFGEAVTDGEGFYSIPGFKAYPFFAWANPHEDGPSGIDPTISSLMIDIGSSSFTDGVKTSDAFLQSTSLPNITGRLVDAYGPLSGKSIEVYEVDQSEPYPAFQHKCTVNTDTEGHFGLSSDDVPCLNLWEPAALLRFPGDADHQGEFYDNADGDWAASQIPVNWGWTNDIGDWQITATG